MNVLQHLQVWTMQNNMRVRSDLHSVCKGKIYPQNQNKLCWSRPLRGTTAFFLSVLFVFTLLHCGEDIKPAQQDFNQDFLLLCMKMISRDNEIQWSFLVGLQYVTAWTTFQPTEIKEKPSESTMYVPHTVQRAPHAANPSLISPSGVKWETPGYRLFSPVPQMVTQRGANKWMTSCPRGWHQWQQIRVGVGGEEVRRRGSNRRRGEKTLQSQDGQTKHSALLQLKGSRCQMLRILHHTKALLVI